MPSNTAGQQQERMMITKTKQIWAVGEMVKVGFMSLRVMATQATPGDYKPDAYILANAKADKFYRFVPHNGLEGGFTSMNAALAA
jgi:hypothetical protein